MSGTQSPSALAAQPPVFRPRVAIKSDGQALPQPTAVQITKSNVTTGSTARIDYSLQGTLPPYWFDPADSTVPAESSIPVKDISILVGYLPDGQPESAIVLREEFRGMITHVDMDLEKQSVSLQARDYSALLVNKQIAGLTWQNERASDIIQKLAGMVGLAVDADPTDGPIGQYRQYEHKALSLASHHHWRTAWDFCVAMQRLTGYDLYVEGKTLHFKKPQTESSAIELAWTPPSRTAPYPQSQVARLHMSRDMLLSRKIVVTVRSWDPKQRTAHVVTYPNPPAQNALPYAFQADPGMTPDRMKTYAAARYDEIMAHARTVTCDIHPQVRITPRTPVRLTGTGTTFDQLYRVDTAETHIDFSTARLAVTLRNRGQLDGVDQE